MTNTPADVVWTAREAFAVAYCWSEFQVQHEGTPETYWLSISERARCECRRVANDMLLLATARGQTVAITRPGPRASEEEAFVRLKQELGLKADHRVWKVWLAVYRAFKCDVAKSARAA